MTSIDPTDIVLHHELTKEATVQTFASEHGDGGACGSNVELRAQMDHALTTHLVQLKDHLDSSLQMLSDRMDSMQGWLEDIVFSHGAVSSTSLQGVPIEPTLSQRCSERPAISKIGKVDSESRCVRFDDTVEACISDESKFDLPLELESSRAAGFKRQRTQAVGRTISEMSVMRGLTKPLQVISDKAATAVYQNKSQPDSRLFRLVKRPCFDLVFFAVILINSAFIGVELQYMSHNVDTEPPLVLKALRVAFMLLFLSELLLRVAAERGDFFVSQDKVWNVFDLVLVISSVTEELFELSLAADSMLQNLFLLRTGRVLRVMRIARILRVMRTFTELRILINSIFCAVKQLLWTVILVVIIIYIVAVLLTQGALDYQQSNPEPVQENVLLLANYGHLENSVYTLFLAFTGGADWADLLAPWFGVSSFYVTIFMCYIILMHFAVIHIVTAVFVESAVQTAQMDHEWNVRQETTQERAFLLEVRRIFNKGEGDETITLAELEDHLSNESVRLRLRCLGLDISEACHLFRLLDVDDRGFLDCGNFARGCLRLRGQARSVDTAMLIHENKRILRSMRLLEQRLVSLDHRMGEALESGGPPDDPSIAESSAEAPGQPVAEVEHRGEQQTCFAGRCHTWRWLWPVSLQP